jgi:hypothetical protein
VPMAQHHREGGEVMRIAAVGVSFSPLPLLTHGCGLFLGLRCDNVEGEGDIALAHAAKGRCNDDGPGDGAGRRYDLDLRRVLVFEAVPDGDARDGYI